MDNDLSRPHTPTESLGERLDSSRIFAELNDKRPNNSVDAKEHTPALLSGITSNQVLAGGAMLAGTLMFHNPNAMRGVAREIGELDNPLLFRELNKNLEVVRGAVESDSKVARVLEDKAASFVHIIGGKPSREPGVFVPDGNASGVLVQRNDKVYVASVNHVLEAPGTPFIRRLGPHAEDSTADGRYFTADREPRRITPVRPLIGNQAQDAAIFEVNPEFVDQYAPHALDLNGPPPAVTIGKPVIQIGAGSGEVNDVIVGLGKIQDHGRYRDIFGETGIVDSRAQLEAEWIKTSAPARPGVSGGPLYDDDGKLVGLLSFIQAKFPHGPVWDNHSYSGVVPIRHIMNLIDKSQAEGEQLGRLGVRERFVAPTGYDRAPSPPPSYYDREPTPRPFQEFDRDDFRRLDYQQLLEFLQGRSR